MLKHFLAGAATAATIAVAGAQFAAPAAVVTVVVTQPVPVHAQEAPQTPPETASTSPVVKETPEKALEDVSSLIERYAAKYGVSSATMRYLVSCETAGTFDPTIQSRARYPIDRPDWGVKAGEQELSFGLAQIHLPAHPGITRAEAENPDFALDFMARELKAGNRRMWSC